MILKTLVVGRFQTNCYIVASEQTHEAMVIDPGGDAKQILAAINSAGVQVKQIVLTHFHFDHISAVDSVRSQTGARVAIHRDEAALLAEPPALFRFFVPNVPRGLVADHLLQHGDTLNVGELVVQVLHTPGHSPGGISLWIASEGVVFCGDALFREGIGRTDFPGSSHEALQRSIRERLFTLPDETIVYPGHGPSTTIGHERKYNPWVEA